MRFIARGIPSWALNLTGFFHITQRAIWEMVNQGGGHIVNVTTSIVDHANSQRPSALRARHIRDRGDSCTSTGDRPPDPE
jgi:NAD(P)-dependent dehydrogenase (short-subunit alcohol dehydrogenase family)